MITKEKTPAGNSTLAIGWVSTPLVITIAIGIVVCLFMENPPIDNLQNDTMLIS